MSANNGLIGMPASILGRYRNGQTTEPCDMIEGPCVCGAWHHLYDWDDEVRAIILSEHPWAIKLLSDKKLRSVRKTYGDEWIGYRHLQPVGR